MHTFAKLVSLSSRRAASLVNPLSSASLANPLSSASLSKPLSSLPSLTTLPYSSTQNRSTLPLGSSLFATDNTLSTTLSTTLNKLGHTPLLNQPLQASNTNQTRRFFSDGRKFTLPSSSKPNPAVTPNPSNPIPALKVPPDIPSSKNLAHDHCHAHKEKEEHGHDLGHTHKEDNKKKDTKKEGTKKEDTKKEDTKQEDHGQDSKTPPNFFSFIYSEKFKTGIVNVIVVTIISSIVQISISRYSADSNVTIARDNNDANIRLQADTLKLKVENAAKAFAASELKLDIGKADKQTNISNGKRLRKRFKIWRSNQSRK